MAITDMIPWKRRESEGEEEAGALQVRQDPFLSFQQQMNQMFDDFFRGTGLEHFGPMRERWETLSPRVDVTETDKEVKVSAELPGLDEKEIDLSLSRDMLTIRGEKRREEEEQGRNYYRAERSYGAFHRSVPLPAPVDADRADAVFRKGVLTVILPKASTVEGRKKITIKSR
jgi:HSP20 family protein